MDLIEASLMYPHNVGRLADASCIAQYMHYMVLTMDLACTFCAWHLVIPHILGQEGDECKHCWNMSGPCTKLCTNECSRRLRVHTCDERSFARLHIQAATAAACHILRAYAIRGNCSVFVVYRNRAVFQHVPVSDLWPD